MPCGTTTRCDAFSRSLDRRDERGIELAQMGLGRGLELFGKGGDVAGLQAELGQLELQERDPLADLRRVAQGDDLELIASDDAHVVAAREPGSTPGGSCRPPGPSESPRGLRPRRSAGSRTPDRSGEARRAIGTTASRAPQPGGVAFPFAGASASRAGLPPAPSAGSANGDRAGADGRPRSPCRARGAPAWRCGTPGDRRGCGTSPPRCSRTLSSPGRTPDRAPARWRRGSGTPPACLSGMRL